MSKIEFIPRDYQQESFDKTVAYLNSGGKAGYLVLPTGTGKSFIIAMLVEYLVSRGDKVLILQPSIELLKQNIEKYHMINTKVDASIFSASIKKEMSGCTYATLGSIKSLGSDFRKLGVRYVIVDECDSKYPQGNKSMFGKFLLDLKPKAIIGLTATPYRYHSTLAGGVKLKYLHQIYPKRFKDIIHIVNVEDIIEKYWATFYIEESSVKTSMLKLKSTGINFSEYSVQKFAIDNFSVRNITRYIKVKAPHNSSILVFCSSVAMAEHLSSLYENSGVVSANTPKKERKKLVDDFKSGKIQIMFNYSVFSIGFDHPALSLIILANPIGSFKLYYQIVGRAVRPHENKAAVIVDLGGNAKRFGDLKTLRHELDSNGVIQSYTKDKDTNLDKQLTNIRLN